MNIVMLQHTFNPTTTGWVRGLEARGHRVLTVVANDTEPFGGWAEDLQVAIVPDSAGLIGRVLMRLFSGRKSAVFAVPQVRHLRRVLVEFETDAVLVKVYSLRNVVALLVAHRSASGGSHGSSSFHRPISSGGSCDGSVSCPAGSSPPSMRDRAVLPRHSTPR